MKMSFYSAIMAVASLLFLVPSVRAQATSTASRALQIQAGAGLLYLNNDYTPKGDEGVSAWIDASLSSLIGVEAEGHLGNIKSPSDYGENTAFLGPRVTHRFGRIEPYGKVMFGFAALKQEIGNKTNTYHYIAYEAGGGVDFRVTSRWSWRVIDAGFQKWPTYKPNGLSPYTVSTGFMYIIP